MEIRGRLEALPLPQERVKSAKSARDSKMHFIVKEAAWSSLPALLSPERPIIE